MRMVPVCSTVISVDYVSEVVETAHWALRKHSSSVVPIVVFHVQPVPVEGKGLIMEGAFDVDDDFCAFIDHDAWAGKVTIDRNDSALILSVGEEEVFKLFQWFEFVAIFVDKKGCIYCKTFLYDFYVSTRLVPGDGEIAKRAASYIRSLSIVTCSPGVCQSVFDVPEVLADIRSASIIAGLVVVTDDLARFGLFWLGETLM